MVVVIGAELDAVHPVAERQPRALDVQRRGADGAEARGARRRRAPRSGGGVARAGGRALGVDGGRGADARPRRRLVVDLGPARPLRVEGWSAAAISCGGGDGEARRFGLAAGGGGAAGMGTEGRALVVAGGACGLAAAADDFGAVLLEHELDLAGKDLEEGPVAGLVGEDTCEGVAEVGF